MRRVLFQWRGIQVHAYPALLYLGLVGGVLGGTYGATRHGLDPARTCAAMLLLVPAALVGARLLHVAAHWPVYRREPRRIWRRSDGGAALYGGLVLAFLLSLPLLAGLGLPIGAFWDAATVTILIGMVCTRVGCLLNGCCAGRPAEGPWALYLPNVYGVWCRRLPTQLLEAGLAVALLLGSLAVWDRLPFGGALFLGNLAAYGTGRWGLEVTREDCDTVGSVRLHRALSAGFVALAIGGLLFLGLLGPVLTQAPEGEAGPRMSVWSFWLTPLAVLAVLALFRFVGCNQILGLEDTTSIGSDNYPEEVVSDEPVAYWRLSERDPSGPLPPDWPNGAKATNEVGIGGAFDGTYTKPASPIPSDPTTHSPGANPIKLELGLERLLVTFPFGNTAIRVQGGFVRVDWAAALNPGEFSLEAVVLPEWDLQNPAQRGNYFSVLASLSAAAQAGYALFAGPAYPKANPGDPDPEYHWQVWVGTGVQFEQLPLKDFAPNGAGGLTYTGPDPGRTDDPGPRVESLPTYLVVTFDGANYNLFLHFPNRDISWARYELLPPASGPYTPNGANDLLIGLADNTSSPLQFPFSGKLQEVAVYDKALGAGRILAHGMAGFRS